MSLRRCPRSRPLRLAAGMLAASLPVMAASGGPRLATPVLDGPADRVGVEPGDVNEEAKLAEVDAGAIRFRNGLVLRPEAGLDTGTPLDPGSVVLLQFPGPVKAAWLGALRRDGFTVQEHLQPFAVIATLPSGAGPTLEKLLGDGTLRAVIPYPTAARLARDLLGAKGPAQVSVEVTLVPDRPGTRTAIRGMLEVDGERDGTRPRLRGRIPAARIEELAAVEGVLWIERATPGHPHNLEASMAGAADAVAGVGNYDGSGVRVAVVDTGVTRTGDLAQCGGAGATYHPDLWVARIADEWDFQNSDANACDDDGHGTHTAGTIGGDGTNDPAWSGIAPNATFLVYKDCCGVGGLGFLNFDDVLTRAAAHDAAVVANSWGGSNGVYDANSYDADAAVRGSYAGSGGGGRPMFVSVSSGNDRDLVSAPGTAKNVVTVGATKDGNWPDDGGGCWFTNTCNLECGNCMMQTTCGDDFVQPTERVCFSNTGPVDTDGDGNSRIKPDLVAPGTRIRSLAASHLYGGELYREEDGTSMAQPSVAGTAALMIDAYPSVELWPEMVKARLLATAIPLGNAVEFGRGMLDSYHAVYDSSYQLTRRWEGASIAATGQEIEYAFTVTPAFREVRVFLAWSDAPSLTTEVVNDLDLRVYDGSDALVANSLSYDDTVEAARISTGTPGTWRAVIRGFNLPAPPARFGLVALEIDADPALDLQASPGAICAGRGQSVPVVTTLENTGAPAAMGQIFMDLPDDASVVQLQDAVLWSDDVIRSNVYPENAMYHDPIYNYYGMTVGHTSYDVWRDVNWNLAIGPAAAEGNYFLYVDGTAYGQPTASAIVPVQVDTTAPGDVPALAAEDRLAGSCSPDLTVDMGWTPAGDPGGCGVSGYGLTWSQGSPALPPELPVIGPVSGYSETLAESSTPYYFNLRTVDAAGNWAPGYRSWGPFRLDATPPDSVTYLASESHPPGACTDVPEVFLNWGAAPDDYCGLAGYSYNWNDGFPLFPDAVQDIGPETQLADVLAPSNAARYFTIRAVDEAGNWSDSAIYHGPIYVDTIPAALSGLTLTPSGNDLVFDWSTDPDADGYVLYADTDPAFGAPVPFANPAVNLHVETGAMLDPTPITYYRVVGTNICGAEGP